MVHFTRGVNDGVFTIIRDLQQYIISMPICHTHTYFTSTEIVDHIIYLLLIIKEYIYKNILLISDGPVSFNPGGDEADGYKRKYLLLPINLFFMSVYSTGPSTVCEALQ